MEEERGVDIKDFSELDSILEDEVQRVESIARTSIDSGNSSDSEITLKKESPKGSPKAKKGIWSAFRTEDSTTKELQDSGDYIRSTASTRGGKVELKQLVFVQCLHNAHKGPILDLQFSKEGAFLASAGQDGRVVLWRVLQAVKEDFDQWEPQRRCDSLNLPPKGPKLFASEPWRVFNDHKGPVVQLSWSTSQFLLSASDDCTARLWHVRREQCLYIFRHTSPVTSVAFLPKSDTVLVTGALDQTVRVWDIPEERVMHWHRLSLQVTALSFSMDGSTIIVGLEDGEVHFLKYDKESGMEFYTQIECRNRRGIQRKGKRVTGIQPCTLSNAGRSGKSRELLLVSTNDSRVRLCSLDTYLCLCKYKGATNSTSLIRASVCDFSEFVISPSEDKSVCIWRAEGFDQESSTTPIVASKKILGNVSKKCGAYEFFQAHGSVVHCAVIAPARTVQVARNFEMMPSFRGVENHGNSIISSESTSGSSATLSRVGNLKGALIVSGGGEGHIHVFENEAGV